MRVQVGDSSYTVEWSHARFEPRPLLLPSGREKWVHGATTCIIAPAEEPAAIGTVMGVLGVAWCSVDDVFIKEKGRKESLKEALEKWGIPREQRAEVWEQYHGRD